MVPILFRNAQPRNAGFSWNPPLPRIAYLMRPQEALHGVQLKFG
jgi:hypothetical protein